MADEHHNNDFMTQYKVPRHGPDLFELVVQWDQGLDAISTLLQKGEDPDTLNSHGISPMHLAAQIGNLSALKLLINAGGNINLTSSKKTDYQVTALGTPLHEAITHEQNEVADWLLHAGANPNVKDVEGETALHKAVLKNNRSLVKILLKYKAQINALDRFDDTALHKAARQGNLEIVKLLVENGAAVEAHDRFEDTALYEAVRKGHLEIVQYLARHGGDINASSSENSMLHEATLLHEAIRDGHEEIVTWLVAQGVDINKQDQHGVTALHEAVLKNDMGSLELLLKVKANINLKNREGNTALHEAARYGNFELLKLLVNYRGDVNTVNNNGYSPLQEAIIEAHENIVLFLIKHGANIHVTIPASSGGNYSEATPLHQAIMLDRTNIVCHLIEAGAKIDSKALATALKKKSMPMLGLLVLFETEGLLSSALISELFPQEKSSLYQSIKNSIHYFRPKAGNAYIRSHLQLFAYNLQTPGHPLLRLLKEPESESLILLLEGV